jgi:hypothetical protein
MAVGIADEMVVEKAVEIVVEIGVGMAGRFELPGRFASGRFGLSGRFEMSGCFRSGRFR